MRSLRQLVDSYANGEQCGLSRPPGVVRSCGSTWTAVGPVHRLPALPRALLGRVTSAPPASPTTAQGCVRSWLLRTATRPGRTRIPVSSSKPRGSPTASASPRFRLGLGNGRKAPRDAPARRTETRPVRSVWDWMRTARTAERRCLCKRPACCLLPAESRDRRMQGSVEPIGSRMRRPLLLCVSYVSMYLHTYDASGVVGLPNRQRVSKRACCSIDIISIRILLDRIPPTPPPPSSPLPYLTDIYSFFPCRACRSPR